MRSQHQTRQARTLAFVTTANIADRVEMRGHAGLAHPLQQQISSGAMLWREKYPRQRVRRLGDRRQRRDAADDLFAKRSVSRGFSHSHFLEADLLRALP